MFLKIAIFQDHFIRLKIYFHRKSCSFLGLYLHDLAEEIGPKSIFPFYKFESLIIEPDFMTKFPKNDAWSCTMPYIYCSYELIEPLSEVFQYIYIAHMR